MLARESKISVEVCFALRKGLNSLLDTIAFSTTSTSMFDGPEKSNGRLSCRGASASTGGSAPTGGSASRAVFLA